MYHTMSGGRAIQYGVQPTVEVPSKYKVMGTQVREMRKQVIKEADIIYIDR